MSFVLENKTFSVCTGKDEAGPLSRQCRGVSFVLANQWRVFCPARKSRFVCPGKEESCRLSRPFRRVPRIICRTKTRLSQETYVSCVPGRIIMSVAEYCLEEVFQRRKTTGNVALVGVGVHRMLLNMATAASASLLYC